MAAAVSGQLLCISLLNHQKNLSVLYASLFFQSVDRYFQFVRKSWTDLMKLFLFLNISWFASKHG